MKAQPQQRRPFTQQLRDLGLNARQIKSVINHFYYSYNGASLNTFDIWKVEQEEGQTWVYFWDEFRDMGSIGCFPLDYYLSK